MPEDLFIERSIVFDQHSLDGMPNTDYAPRLGLRHSTEGVGFRQETHKMSVKQPILVAVYRFHDVA